MLSSTLLVLIPAYGIALQHAPAASRAAVASRTSTLVMARKPWETANVPRGKVSTNFLENVVTMQDQRVAGCSHINLAPGKCKLPLDEAKALMQRWKEEIGNDITKFAERARSDSHCATAATGGDLGFVVWNLRMEQAVIFGMPREVAPVTVDGHLVHRQPAIARFAEMGHERTLLAG